jgi:hypothetical protein
MNLPPWVLCMMFLHGMILHILQPVARLCTLTRILYLRLIAISFLNSCLRSVGVCCKGSCPIFFLIQRLVTCPCVATGVKNRMSYLMSKEPCCSHEQNQSRPHPTHPTVLRQGVFVKCTELQRTFYKTP